MYTNRVCSRGALGRIIQSFLNILTAGESSALADTLKDGAEVLLIGHDMHDDFRKME